MISIICVYNKEQILNKYLIKSLEEQTFNDYELILVDNSKNKFKSSSEALNFGAKKAKGEYLMFIHQDVELTSKMCLNKINNYLEKIDDFGVIGVAGTLKKDIITNVIHGENKFYAGNIQISKITECECLDEVLFIIKKETYDEYEFDSKNKTWHLYCVDYCLKMRKENKKIYIIPLEIYHASTGGSFDNSYYIEIKRLAKKYNKHFKDIRTTCGMWKTNSLILNFQILKRKLKGVIKRWLKKV